MKKKKRSEKIEEEISVSRNFFVYSEDFGTRGDEIRVYGSSTKLAFRLLAQLYSFFSNIFRGAD